MRDRESQRPCLDANFASVLSGNLHRQTFLARNTILYWTDHAHGCRTNQGPFVFPLEGGTRKACSPSLIIELLLDSFTFPFKGSRFPRLLGLSLIIRQISLFS